VNPLSVRPSTLARKCMKEPSQGFCQLLSNNEKESDSADLDVLEIDGFVKNRSHDNTKMLLPKNLA
jgi:hypothetical protein